MERLYLALLLLTAVLLVIDRLTVGGSSTPLVSDHCRVGCGARSLRSTWWSKALIAVGTLGGIAAFAPVVWWAAKKINDELRT